MTTNPSSLIQFFQELKRNNNKAWFNERKTEYREMRDAFEEALRHTAEKVAEFDPNVAQRLDEANVVRVPRIYRDLRFTNNPDPLKTSISGVISAGEGRPAYYLQIEPAESRAGGGLHQPDPKVLKAVREEIDETHEELKAILESDPVQVVYPGGFSEENALKTSPRDFSADHPAVDLLRLKSFVALRPFTNIEVRQDDFNDEVVQTFKVQRQLNKYLEKALRRLDKGR